MVLFICILHRLRQEREIALSQQQMKNASVEAEREGNMAHEHSYLSPPSSIVQKSSILKKIAELRIKVNHLISWTEQK